MNETQFEQLRQTMLQQSFLFDDPYSYRCGVEDALTAMAAATVDPALGEGAGGWRMTAAS